MNVAQFEMELGKDRIVNPEAYVNYQSMVYEARLTPEEFLKVFNSPMNKHNHIFKKGVGLGRYEYHVVTPRKGHIYTIFVDVAAPAGIVNKLRVLIGR